MKKAAAVARRMASGGSAGRAHLHAADDHREELEHPQGNQHARGSNPSRTHQLLSLFDPCSWCPPAAHEHRQGALLEQLSGNEGSKEANGEGVRESVCHDGVKQLAAAVNRAGLSASFNCRRDDEVGDAGAGGAGGKGEGRVEDDEGRLGTRGNGLGRCGWGDGDFRH